MRKLRDVDMRKLCLAQFHSATAERSVDMRKLMDVDMRKLYLAQFHSVTAERSVDMRKLYLAQIQHRLA